MLERKLLVATVIGALALPGAVLAADPPAPAIPTLTQIFDASGLTVTGYIDASFANLTGEGAFVNGIPNRVFDTQENSFNLQQAAITIAKQPKEGFGGLVNVILGDDAQIIHSYDEQAGAGTNRYDLTQAYVQYATGPLTVMAGKYVTNAGAETINPTAMTNFSRSILFGYAIPFAHTGIRAVYAINDMVTVLAGVNNGWDDLKDTNDAKTAEFGVTITPMKGLSILLTDYVGSERVGGLVGNGPQGNRNIFDLVVNWAATDALSFTVNYDYGFQEDTQTVTPNASSKAKWDGVAGYVNYQFNDMWRISVRGEYFDDKDGYRTGIEQKWKEGTVTLGFMPAKSTEIRLEARGDVSSKASFVQTDNGEIGKTQYSYDVEAIYKF